MNFTTAAGQLLLAITILLNEGLKSKCSYEEFMRELSYDNEYCNQLRGVHEEMWLVYRDSNVNVKSEDLDDLGLMLILELVARDANYIMDMRSLLNQLAEAIAQIVGNNEVITSALDELRGRVERDKQIIAELEGEQNTMKREPTGTIADLDQLVGLSLVKSEVTALKRFVEVNKRRQEMGMKTPTVSYHCVFTGNPGTGKTTVARIVAGIYKDLGILSKGHLVETDRSGLVAEYVGQTAIKTNKIIDSALDGVLFLDEAYSLVAGGKEDYGKEAIATLLKRMEDDRDRLVVILAGYEDEMKQFVDSNPGLRSRFNRYIHFEDYSADELMQIFSNQLRAFDYTIDSRAETVLQQHLEQCVATRGKDFGNARYVRNLFERTIEAQAVRLSSLAEPDSKALSRITEHDVTTALNRMSHQ
ncbi:MAG: AAA family ATPase [Muribaculaceae bacterium]|nr:AAA family ATPase [Muribaculaceae bacterium]